MAAVVPKYCVRKATRADVAAIKNFTNIEEWDIPTDLMYCLFDMDSRAWFVAESDSGEILGCRVLVYFTEETVVGGIYIVRKDLRGKGIGRDVNAQTLKTVGGASVITIPATFVNQYDTSGFTFYYDVHLKRGPAEIFLGAIAEAEVSSLIRIHPYESAMFTELKVYDENVCETERCYFFKNWIIGHAKHILIARSNAGRILGYGRLAVTEYGNEIAPLYADSDIIATTLLKRLLQQVNPKDSVDMFIPSESKAMMEINRKVSVTNVVTLHKMYTKKQVPRTPERLYSLSAMVLAAA